MVPIVSFVGRHNSGKTTVLVEVIKHLKQEGIETAVIKHASHSLAIQPITDSDRLFDAGAGTVYVTSPDISIHYSRHYSERSLFEIYEGISKGVDLVITEGYKKETTRKIEVIRQDIDPKPLQLENLIARVCDFHVDHQVPEFTFEQYTEIARFIIETFQLKHS